MTKDLLIYQDVECIMLKIFCQRILYPQICGPLFLRLLSSMCDMIIVGASNHSHIQHLADEASVPVITGVSQLLQPLQILAYFMTLQVSLQFDKEKQAQYPTCNENRRLHMSVSL